MVVELFGEVENKNVPIPEFPEHPFQEEHLKVSEWLISVSSIFLHTSTLTMHSRRILVINEMLEYLVLDKLENTFICLMF